MSSQLTEKELAELMPSEFVQHETDSLGSFRAAFFTAILELGRRPHSIRHTMSDPGPFERSAAECEPWPKSGSRPEIVRCSC